MTWARRFLEEDIEMSDGTWFYQHQWSVAAQAARQQLANTTPNNTAPIEDDTVQFNPIERQLTTERRFYEWRDIEYGTGGIYHRLTHGNECACGYNMLGAIDPEPGTVYRACRICYPECPGCGTRPCTTPCDVCAKLATIFEDAITPSVRVIDVDDNEANTDAA